MAVNVFITSPVFMLFPFRASYLTITNSAVDIIRVKACMLDMSFCTSSCQSVSSVERLCLMFDCVSLYFYLSSSSLLLPVLSTIRFFVFSYDVIHSLGIYSFGIKIDAIPGRFNFASTIRTLIKGEHRGFCYELCGHGHSSMLLIAKTS